MDGQLVRGNLILFPSNNLWVTRSLFLPHNIHLTNELLHKQIGQARMRLVYNKLCGFFRANLNVCCPLDVLAGNPSIPILVLDGIRQNILPPFL